MRPPRYVRPLTNEERDAIENLYRHGPNGRIRKRAQAIRLSALGYDAPEIAGILGCNRQSIHNWINAFETAGLDALADKSRSGRPPIATAEYRKQLIKAIKVNPHDLGYPFTVWTVTRIRAHLARELHILLSESRVRQIMAEEQLVFKCPKHSLADKRNPDAFAAVRQILDELKKMPWIPVPA